MHIFIYIDSNTTLFMNMHNYTQLENIHNGFFFGAIFPSDNVYSLNKIVTYIILYN